MLKIPFLIAQVYIDPEADAIKRAAAKDSVGWGGEVGWIIGAVLVVVAVLFFWAFFLRKRPQHHHGALVVERAKKISNDEAHGKSGRRKHRKRRPEHPDNWGRAPTLGETGGLPPARTESEQSPEATDGSPEPQR